MFHTLITLSYIIPGIYIFLRIWNLFILKDWRKWYILIFTVLFIIYPAGNLLGENSTGLFSKYLSATANYLLPFFLYLFLLILFTDLLLLINLPLKIVSKEKMKDRTLKKIVFISIIGVSLIIVLGGIINFNSIRSTEYFVDIKRESSDISKLKIAFVSDFHLQEGTPLKFVQRFLKKVNGIRPDIMIFGGDIVEGDNENENMVQFENILTKVETRYGVYGVLGNHEHYARQDKGSFFNKSGIRILCDTTFIAGKSFILAGRNDSHISSRKSVSELLKSIPDSLPVIILDHRPTGIDEVSKTNSDIQLSGHTHDGQLFPINLITNMIYKLSYGYMKSDNTHFFVSSGIRLWGPPVRTIRKSEIMVINVNLLK
jgi:predicted MPP superfamily phosphohydrolase